MQIILMCKEESATSVMRSERINGEEAPARQYVTTNHVTMLSGFSDNVLHHDCEDLLRNPIFRMPTLAEQEAMFQETQQVSQAQEASLATFTTQVNRVNGDSEAILIAAAVQSDTEQEAAPDDSPALSKKQKASGG